MSAPHPHSGIELRKLSVAFESAGQSPSPVLRDVSLAIPPRSVVGLVGESGSGKSTVALTLMGLLAPNARVSGGEFALGDRDIACDDVPSLASLRGREIAMVFQDPAASLNPVFRVDAHLNEVLRLRAPELSKTLRRDGAVAALAEVGISRPKELMRAFSHELSGGMRQRVVIAMALLARPRLLIADEPTTALDVTVEAQVMERLCALRDKIGCSILLITHSLGLVARYCDEVALLYAGEIVEQGRVSEVVNRPAHPYTAALFACDVGIDEPRACPPLEHRFQVIPGELPDPRQRPSGCIYAPRCNAARPDCRAVHPDLAPLADQAGRKVRCRYPL